MTDIITAENGLSRQDELEFARALQFLGTQRVLVLQAPKKGGMKKPDIPNVEVHAGVLFDKASFSLSGSYADGLRALDANGIEADRLREVIEKHDFEIMLNFCTRSRKKTMHYPSGAIGQVTAALMKQKGIIAAFSPSDFEHLDAAIFNASVLSKEKVSMAFCSNAKAPLQLRNEKDLLSIASILRVDESIIKKSRTSIDDALRYKSYNSGSIRAQR